MYFKFKNAKECQMCAEDQVVGQSTYADLSLNTQQIPKEAFSSDFFYQKVIQNNILNS